MPLAHTMHAFCAAVFFVALCSAPASSLSVRYHRSPRPRLVDDITPPPKVTPVKAPLVPVAPVAPVAPVVHGVARKPCTVEIKGHSVAGKCVAFVQCPAHVLVATPTVCTLPSGQIGVCCTTGQNHSDFNALSERVGYVSPSLHELERLVYRSHLKMRQLVAHTAQILAQPYKHQLFLERGTPGFGHFLGQGQVERDPEHVWEVGQGAVQMTFATEQLKRSNGLTNRQLELGLMNANMRETVLGDVCQPDPECPPTPYRSLDGTCNNLLRPRWGAIRGPMERLLPPSYNDGIWSVRVSAMDGRELPNARYISSRAFNDIHAPHDHFTLMLMQFGQFIVHDITLSPSMKHPDGKGISCCEKDGSEMPLQFQHFACYPILIPENDPFYKSYDQRCMNVVRATLAPRYDCSLGYAQQMNRVSHFLDGSMLYGTDEEMLSTLRTFEGGQLLMFNDFNRDLLPLAEDQEECLTMERGSACFRAGDSRVNQQVTLVALHLLFNREHNRLARHLALLNPHWSDETLFQEARRIVVAELQHIMYAEWLPLVIGKKAIEDFGLGTWYNSKSSDYDVDVNPSITNEFSVAAFRFGHSTVDGRLRIMKQNQIDEVILLPEVMFDPSKMRSTEFFDRMLMMLTSQPMQNVDPSLTESLNRYLFRSGNPFGVDLGAINIQRGRDHGLAPYNAYRQTLNLPRARNFEDFADLMDPEAINALREVYASPDDVDLFVGGLHERHVPGALVGPTFLGIIADQFSRLRQGDRFFYHHAGFPHSFSGEQLGEIKKVTLSRIICDNSDNIELHHVSPNSFVRRDYPGNELVHCSSPQIGSIDLRFWQGKGFK